MQSAPTFRTPILLLIFNRPDNTRTVFETIERLKPARLYVAADGARTHVPGEEEKCIQTRQIISSISWPCELKTLYRDHNLGCKRAVSSAITWFFENESEGIILEDDCVANPSFFTFCQTLLHTYRDDERIMHIGGSNFQPEPNGDASYYFSNYNHVWGWATWRRAWTKYDRELEGFPQFIRTHQIDRILGNNPAKYNWLYRFWKCYKDRVDTWDYQWTFSIWNNNGVSITPTKNLVSNIGFGEDATHTKTVIKHVSNRGTSDLGEVVHPPSVEIDAAADRITERVSFKAGNPLRSLLLMLFVKLLKFNIR